MKAIILAGGSGTRLFPLSRKYYPKQFLKIGKELSLFQRTIKRISSIFNIEDIYIIANESYKFHIREQIGELFSPSYADRFIEEQLIIEPAMRNTAPAIALGIKFLLEKGISKDDGIFIFPSDHIIIGEEKFIDYIKGAFELTKDGHIITFGIKPKAPETGYGYIEAGEIIKEGVLAYRVKRFYEKPNEEKAKQYIEAGNFFWNSGMFVFSISTILQEYQSYMPEIYSVLVSSNYESFFSVFPSFPSISIDYAIMEKSNKIVVFPLDIEWSDLGSFDALYDFYNKDENGNLRIGKTIAIDTKNSLLLSTKGLIASIGINNIGIIETDDIVVIYELGKGQDIRKLVEELKKDKEYKELVEYHTTVHRPWGSFTLLEKGHRYKIKKIIVKPSESISLQLHFHRSEHWIVVRGTAKILLENEKGELDTYFVYENESIYIPKTKKHKIENPGKIPLEIIEVQVGEYLEEDDIIRFEDKYKRR
jgi:mannose-1-phosphate guanylyltransferase/mannose-6-phosphate isomerase